MRSALTIDQIENTPPLTSEQIYAMPFPDADQIRVGKLTGYFGYTYEQARSIPRYWADWFIGFREETGV